MQDINLETKFWLLKITNTTFMSGIKNSLSVAEGLSLSTLGQWVLVSIPSLGKDAPNN